MVLDQVAEPMQLLAARIDEGSSLTANQCKLVLSLYGVQYRSSRNQKKRDFYMAVLSIFLSSPEEQEKALEKSNLNQAQAQDSEEEADSEFEDLLQGVEELNLGDPDLRAEKEKLKQRKNKQKLDGVLLELSRGRVRGRGRGRGRGRFREGAEAGDPC